MIRNSPALLCALNWPLINWMKYSGSVLSLCSVVGISPHGQRSVNTFVMWRSPKFLQGQKCSRRVHTHLRWGTQARKQLPSAENVNSYLWAAFTFESSKNQRRAMHAHTPQLCGQALWGEKWTQQRNEMTTQQWKIGAKSVFIKKTKMEAWRESASNCGNVLLSLQGPWCLLKIAQKRKFKNTSPLLFC